MTYLGLDLVFLAVTAAVAVLAARRARLDRRWWATVALVAAVLIVLTVVFDSVMVAADLFRYDSSALLGLHLGLTPVEDLAWPLAAAVLLPALWELLGSRNADRHGPPPPRRPTERSAP